MWLQNGAFRYPRMYSFLTLPWRRHLHPKPFAPPSDEKFFGIRVLGQSSGKGGMSWLERASCKSLKHYGTKTMEVTRGVLRILGGMPPAPLSNGQKAP